ncbi:sensor histidine kinase [Variovorax sp. J22R133]|uniref:sensor histidine kinase n=1 Tax=Variovorax brevis TaxID=3053503 RepID=UPI0025771FC5|nr:sensor histidine kinase [Variovorax sp. J22R133]MDM0112711.1 sensor histidine kinase [Variovorax sp. J22R133]
MAEPRRIGIRTLLLALLLPGIVLLLAVDSWNDYRDISRVVGDAYDQVLVEPVQALNDSVVLGADGKPRMEAAFSVEAMFESRRSRRRYLHVGHVPVSRAADGAVQTSATAQETTLTGVPDFPKPPPGPDGQPYFHDATYRDDPVRIATLRRTIWVTPSAGYLIVCQAAESIGARQQALDASWHQALWNDLRLVILMVVLVWLGVWLSLRPLERLRRAVAIRRPGALEPLDASGVPYEVVPLVDAVNHHIGSQSRLLAAQTRFLADASHQLRTPLAIMLAQAGYALRERDAEPMRDTLRAIVVQLTRARRLSEQLLSLAHANETAPPAGGATADLNAVAREVVLQHLPLAHEKQQDLGWVDARGDTQDDEAEGDIEDPVAPVAADAAELHEALSNLVHNAIKYTPEGGRVTVTVRLADDAAEAEVCDTGPGIAQGRRDAVFERFAQGAASDADDARGAGLGLAIARAYARRHGGDITLDDAPGIDGVRGGLRATLRIPRDATRPMAPTRRNG